MSSSKLFYEYKLLIFFSYSPLPLPFKRTINLETKPRTRRKVFRSTIFPVHSFSRNFPQKMVKRFFGDPRRGEIERQGEEFLDTIRLLVSPPSCFFFFLPFSTRHLGFDFAASRRSAARFLPNHRPFIETFIEKRDVPLLASNKREYLVR